VLSVLQFTESDYPFGIFKLFLNLNNDDEEWTAYINRLISKGSITFGKGS